jgi:hypothetical protein
VEEDQGCTSMELWMGIKEGLEARSRVPKIMIVFAVPQSSETYHYF